MTTVAAAFIVKLHCLFGIIKDASISCVLSKIHTTSLFNVKDKHLYNQYSLRMKQKLAIAQAIMEKPNFILLDEPTNSLDEESVEAVRVLLQEEHERGALLASHNKDDLRILVNDIFIIEEGRINYEKSIL